MLLSISAASVFAQSSLIATLSHEGEITAFYGASALQQAHEAAVHGDVITLSSGTFLPVDITKAITLRGAGMELDSVNNILPTVISDDFKIGVVDDSLEHLTMEGIYHNHNIVLNGKISNAVFIKNRFGKLRCSETENTCLDNCSFVHCKIANELRVSQSGTSCNVTNCYIGKFGYIKNENSGSSMSFSNCIVNTSFVDNRTASEANAWIERFYNCSFVNCVIIGTNRFITQNYATVLIDKLPLNSTAYHSVSINCSGGCFGNISNTTNQHSTFDEVFKEFTGTYNDNITFELTDEAKTKFLGTDGTQVGIYGGAMPFDPITTNPRITKCSVAAKSTADGKLSVDIEVNGAE